MTTTVDLATLEFGIGNVSRLVKRSPSALRKAEHEQRIPPARRDHLGRRVYDLSDIKAIARSIKESQAGRRREVGAAASA